MSRGGTELFLGGLSKDTRRGDLEDIFSKYGRITRCDIKYVNGYAGTAYGFIGYDDDRNAEDAIKNENGRKICGCAVVIERSKTKPWTKSTKVPVTRDRHVDRSAHYGYRRRSYSRSRSRERTTHRHHRRHRSRSSSKSRSRSRSTKRRSHRTKRDVSRSKSRSRSRSRSRRNRHKKSQSVSRSRSRSFSRSPADQAPKEEDVKDNIDFESDLNEGNSANGITINEAINQPAVSIEADTHKNETFEENK